MHPTNWTCCTTGQEQPWWSWLIVGATALVGIISLIRWAWRGLRGRRLVAESEEPTDSPVWASAMAVRFRRVGGRTDPPRPESVEEVALWTRSEIRRVDLIYAPVFWVLLPIAALGYLIWGISADASEPWMGSLLQDDTGEPWNFWETWIGVGIWFLVTVGILIMRLRRLPDVQVRNRWIFEHGVAHSAHRTSVDYDDSDVGRQPTYIALDHRLDDRAAARIYEAFEIWLEAGGMPPSGSGPISSATLFGAQAKGGYFFIHIPIDESAGRSAQHRWMLITEPRDGEAAVIVTPIPARTDFHEVRDKARLRAARRARRDPNISTSTEVVKWEP